MSCDVIVVGAGPVGLLTARLLGLAGHDVVVLEKWPDPYPLPRAVHFDHEIGRILQSAGLAGKVRGISQRVPDHYEWRNRDGELLVRIDWSQDGACGWPVASFFSQPDLETVLADSLDELPNVELRRGCPVIGLSQDETGVEVSFTTADGNQATLTGQYVIGCDGANSFVRSHIGSDTTDLGFDYDWLIVDTIPLDHCEWSPMNWQLCDPSRPTTIVSGGPNRRRWEFMRLPGEDRDELNTTGTAWKLLEPWGRTPDNTTMERHAVYTFQARWADDWRDRRVLLAGDAAHLMPPFAGQGMCSGLRDAANLAWKLDLVLRGSCDSDLLNTYTSERREHLQHAISMSVALGHTICVLDEDEAAQRDRRMIDAGADPRTALPPIPPERLGPGAWDDASTPESVRGQLVPQPRVAGADASTSLLDDQLLSERGGFLLLGFEVDPLQELTESRRADLTAFGIQSVLLTAATATERPRTSPETRVIRTAGSICRDWFADNGVKVVLMRPDFYAYGATPTPAGVPGLLDCFWRDVSAARLAALEGRVPSGSK